MSWPVSSITRPLDTGTARDVVVATLLGALALLVLDALFLDQGGLLAPFLGIDAFTSNYLHEFAHDGRHLFGLPCH
jgi:hypothetical protein